MDKEQELLERVKRKVRRIKIFKLHVALYIIVIALLLYNFYIIEEGPYKDNIISLNLSIMVAWTVFIIIHWFIIFKEGKLFNKHWEDKKIKEYTKDKESEKQLWE